MAIKPKALEFLVLTLIVFGVYSLLIVFLMYLNTAVFLLGDPKFGESGWKTFYSQVYIFFFSPTIIASLLITWFNEIPWKLWPRLYAIYIVLVVGVIELEFVLGRPDWLPSFVELIALPVVFLFMAGRYRPPKPE